MADSINKARLLASQQKESGAWLSAPPVSALGLRMDNNTIRIAVGLRLGTALCLPHDCSQCGARVDETGVHALSCRRSQGRLPRHSSLNDIVKRALVAVKVPCTLEPRGLCRGDGKRPDTFAKSNLLLATDGAGLVADQAASNKRRLYSELCQSHFFVPIAVESTGSFGQDAMRFFHELARRTRSETKDPLSYLKLCQKISVCIQRFNSISILGCCSV